MSKVTDFEEPESFDGTETFYIVKDGVDHNVSLEKIKELVKEPPTIVVGDFKW